MNVFKKRCRKIKVSRYLHRYREMSLSNSAGAIVVICPVTTELSVAYGAAVTGGMDELSVSGIHTHMGNAAGVCIFKEDQIACLEVLP